MITSLEKQNEQLKQKINELMKELSRRNNQQTNDKTQKPKLNSQRESNNHKKQHEVSIQNSPHHTCQSLHQDTHSMQLHRPVIPEQPTVPIPIIQPKNPSKFETQQKPETNIKFYTQDTYKSQSNIANSQISKQLQLDQNRQKKLNYFNQTQIINSNKNIYSSAIKQKNNICEQCIIKMNQMNQMEFLKNKYHKQYISVRNQLERLKLEMNQHQTHQTQISSLNLNQIYTDHTNQQKSQKSSFSFQNIQNALLSERFSLQIQQLLKLIDRLLPLDKKCIQLQSTDFKLLYELQMKLQKLKNHLGLQTQPKYVSDLFNQLQKLQQSNKKIHQRYKKLIEKIIKTHKQKMKKNKDQFNEVNQKFIVLLGQLNQLKVNNEKLKKDIQFQKSIQYHVNKSQQISQSKSQKQQEGQSSNKQKSQKEKDKDKEKNLTKQVNQKHTGSPNVQKNQKNITLKESKQLSQKAHHQNISKSQKPQTKQKTQSFALKLDRTLSGSSSQLKSQKQKESLSPNSISQKQLQKLQLKIKNLQKTNIKLTKTIKQIQLQIILNKKKAQNDFNHFFEAIIFNKQNNKKNYAQQIDCILGSNRLKFQQKVYFITIESHLNIQKVKQTQKIEVKENKQDNKQSQQIKSLVFQIFSFTSCQSDQDENVFMPQTQAQIIQMLKHIKKFASKYQQWQKHKQKQIQEFQRNFLNLLKFLIVQFNVSQQDLLSKIQKMKNNQQLLIFIKKYYSKSLEISEEEDRLSNTYTFGKKSDSYKDSESQS